MGKSNEWAAAYLSQAREDLAASKRLAGRNPSVLAMLLQMFFEKLAKAALLRSAQISVKKACGTHAAASRMLEALKLNEQFEEELGSLYRWKDVLALVRELERAQPQLADGRPQLEYPWESADGDVCWPAEHLPIAVRWSDPLSQEAPRLVIFATALSRAFDRVFPE